MSSVGGDDRIGGDGAGDGYGAGDSTVAERAASVCYKYRGSARVGVLKLPEQRKVAGAGVAGEAQRFMLELLLLSHFYCSRYKRAHATSSYGA